MSRLSDLTMLFEPVAAHAMLPFPKRTQLEVLCIHGVDHCPSLSLLSRLTRLELTSHALSGPPVYQASADMSQVIEVCHASSTLLLLSDGFTSLHLVHASGSDECGLQVPTFSWATGLHSPS